MFPLLIFDEVYHSQITYESCNLIVKFLESAIIDFYKGKSAYEVHVWCFCFLQLLLHLSNFSKISELYNLHNRDKLVSLSLSPIFLGTFILHQKIIHCIIFVPNYSVNVDPSNHLMSDHF